MLAPSYPDEIGESRSVFAIQLSDRRSKSNHGDLDFGVVLLELIGSPEMIARVKVATAEEDGPVKERLKRSSHDGIL